MAITTIAGYQAAPKQQTEYFKNGAAISVTGQWVTVFSISGDPTGGTMAVGNTANGTVPTSATTGFSPINPFGLGNTGYLTQVEWTNSRAVSMKMFDCLFRAGAYAFNAATTLTSQPSYSARVPNGDYGNTQIWFEAVTAFSSGCTVTVTYTNQSGTAGRSTGAFAMPTTPVALRCYQMPLQAGDTGVQMIESVTCTVASAGTFNILVLRPLWSGRTSYPGEVNIIDFTSLGMPTVFSDSAMYVLVSSDATDTGVVSVNYVIANG